MTRWVYTFSDPVPTNADERSLLGGKGASLRQMTQAGFTVPPGFTITTECCREYFRLGRQWPEGLEAEVKSHVDRLETVVGRRFGQGERPLLVSVRSGAARSMPGMMDTLLNCGAKKGTGTFSAKHRPGRSGKMYPSPFSHSAWETLADSINAVFNSWNNPRATAYRKRHNIHDLHGTAVNVQVMFPSRVSGVVFTRDPTAPRKERMVVEAAFGLGESVVSGDVTPDRYLVARDNLSDVSAHIGHKGEAIWTPGDEQILDPGARCLDDQQLRRLCELCLRVETHFGHPVDVEFGLADDTFALLQARAINRLDVALAIEPARQEEIARLTDIARKQNRRKVWVAHNLDETLPAPTPLTWDIVRDFMRGDGGFGRLYQRLGYRPSRTVKNEGFLELVCGRIYADPDRLADLFWDGMPFGYDADSLAGNPALLDQAPKTFLPERADGRFLLRVIPTVVAMFWSSRVTRRLRNVAADRFEREILPQWLRWIEAERDRDLGKLDDRGLLDLLDRRVDRTLHGFGPESLLPSFFGGIAFASLSARLTQLMGDEGAALAHTLTLALDGNMTFEQDVLLHRVARGDADLEEAVERFGHRGLEEMELARPRWREDDSFLVQTVERLAKSNGRDSRVVHEANVAKRNEAEAALPNLLARAGGSCFVEEVREDLKQARRLLPYRESGKFYLMMGYELIRGVLEELSARWSLGGDLYFLHRDELARYEANENVLRPTIARRKLTWKALKKLDVGPIVDSRDIERLGLAPDRDDSPKDATEYTGTAVAAGRASGPARIVSDPSEAADLGDGYVLVCSSTDPAWTPLFVNAAALVVERGGVLSHGAIVARDFGIPAVVLPDATRLIADGQPIRVDGDAARVSLLDPGGPQ